MPSARFHTEIGELIDWSIVIISGSVAGLYDGSRLDEQAIGIGYLIWDASIILAHHAPETTAGFQPSVGRKIKVSFEPTFKSWPLPDPTVNQSLYHASCERMRTHVIAFKSLKQYWQHASSAERTYLVTRIAVSAWVQGVVLKHIPIIRAFWKENKKHYGRYTEPPQFKWVEALMGKAYQTPQTMPAQLLTLQDMQQCMQSRLFSFVYRQNDLGHPELFVTRTTHTERVNIGVPDVFKPLPLDIAIDHMQLAGSKPVYAAGQIKMASQRIMKPKAINYEQLPKATLKALELWRTTVLSCLPAIPANLRIISAEQINSKLLRAFNTLQQQLIQQSRQEAVRYALKIAYKEKILSCFTEAYRHPSYCSVFEKTSEKYRSLLAAGLPETLIAEQLNAERLISRISTYLTPATLSQHLAPHLSVSPTSITTVSAYMTEGAHMKTLLTQAFKNFGFDPAALEGRIHVTNYPVTSVQSIGRDGQIPRLVQLSDNTIAAKSPFSAYLQCPSLPVPLFLALLRHVNPKSRRPFASASACESTNRHQSDASATKKRPSISTHWNPFIALIPTALRQELSAMEGSNSSDKDLATLENVLAEDSHLAQLKLALTRLLNHGLDGFSELWQGSFEGLSQAKADWLNPIQHLLLPIPILLHDTLLLSAAYYAQKVAPDPARMARYLQTDPTYRMAMQRMGAFLHEIEGMGTSLIDATWPKRLRIIARNTTHIATTAGILAGCFKTAQRINSRKRLQAPTPETYENIPFHPMHPESMETLSTLAVKKSTGSRLYYFTIGIDGRLIVTHNFESLAQQIAQEVFQGFTTGNFFTSTPIKGQFLTKNGKIKAIMQLEHEAATSEWLANRPKIAEAFSKASYGEVQHTIKICEDLSGLRATAPAVNQTAEAASVVVPASTTVNEALTLKDIKYLASLHKRLSQSEPSWPVTITLATATSFTHDYGACTVKPRLASYEGLLSHQSAMRNKALAKQRAYFARMGMKELIIGSVVGYTLGSEAALAILQWNFNPLYSLLPTWLSQQLEAKTSPNCLIDRSDAQSMPLFCATNTAPTDAPAVVYREEEINTFSKVYDLFEKNEHLIYAVTADGQFHCGPEKVVEAADHASIVSADAQRAKKPSPSKSARKASLDERQTAVLLQTTVEEGLRKGASVVGVAGSIIAGEPGAILGATAAHDVVKPFAEQAGLAMNTFVHKVCFNKPGQSGREAAPKDYTIHPPKASALSVRPVRKTNHASPILRYERLLAHQSTLRNEVLSKQRTYFARMGMKEPIIGAGSVDTDWHVFINVGTGDKVHGFQDRLKEWVFFRLPIATAEASSRKPLIVKRVAAASQSSAYQLQRQFLDVETITTPVPSTTLALPVVTPLETNAITATLNTAQRTQLREAKHMLAQHASRQTSDVQLQQMAAHQIQERFSTTSAIFGIAASITRHTGNQELATFFSSVSQVAGGISSWMTAQAAIATAGHLTAGALFGLLTGGLSLIGGFAALIGLLDDSEAAAARKRAQMIQAAFTALQSANQDIREELQAFVTVLQQEIRLVGAGTAEVLASQATHHQMNEKALVELDSFQSTMGEHHIHLNRYFQELLNADLKKIFYQLRSTLTETGVQPSKSQIKRNLAFLEYWLMCEFYNPALTQTVLLQLSNESSANVLREHPLPFITIPSFMAGRMRMVLGERVSAAFLNLPPMSLYFTAVRLHGEVLKRNPEFLGKDNGKTLFEQIQKTLSTYDALFEFLKTEEAQIQQSALPSIEKEVIHAALVDFATYKAGIKQMQAIVLDDQQQFSQRQPVLTDAEKMLEQIASKFFYPHGAPETHPAFWVKKPTLSEGKGTSYLLSCSVFDGDLSYRRQFINKLSEHQLKVVTVDFAGIRYLQITLAGEEPKASVGPPQLKHSIQFFKSQQISDQNMRQKLII